MNSRMPDQDKIQERLKTVQEEGQRLREENARLRAMLGINQSLPTSPFLIHKRLDWGNEEEVRLILPRGNGSTVKIDPRWLTRIILGMKMSPESEVQIRQWAKQREPGLLVVRAHLDQLHQELLLRQ